MFEKHITEILGILRRIASSRDREEEKLRGEKELEKIAKIKKHLNERG